MITPEEYNRKRDDEEDFGENLPVPAIVVMIVLFSLVGIIIVFAAIFGF